MKRLLDVLVGGVLTCLLLPVVLVFAAGIFVLDPGPPLLRQERVAQHGRCIRVLKLRTMYRDGAQRLAAHLAGNALAGREYETYRCLAQDPRVIPVWGAWARRFSVDEIPQLLDVLRGDISLVGPRTLMPGDLDELFDPAARAIRLSVPQGLTGLWQVSRRGKREAFTTMREWDLAYVRRHSLRVDLWILARTVRAVLSGSGCF